MKKAHKYSFAAMLAVMISILSFSFTYAQRGHSNGGGRSGGGSQRSYGGGGGQRSFGGGSSQHFANPGQRQSFSGSPHFNAPRTTASPRFSPGQGSYPQRAGGIPRSVPGYRSPGYRTPYYSGRGRGEGYYAGGRYYNRPIFTGGFYNRYYAPRIGFHINVLPFGYYPFYYGDYRYFYNDGFFYQQYGANDYQVVAPPIGAEVTQLPAGAQSIIIDGVQYYELNGVYYQPVTDEDGSVRYQIAGKDGQLETNPGPGQGQQQQDDAYPPSNQ